MKKKENGIIHQISSNTNWIITHDRNVSKMYTKILSEIFEGRTIEESMEKLGMYGTIIPVEEIPFDYKSLEKDDVIRPSDDSISLYYVGEGYIIITDDPMSTFVDEEHLKQSWKKR